MRRGHLACVAHRVSGLRRRLVVTACLAAFLGLGALCFDGSPPHPHAQSIGTRVRAAEAYMTHLGRAVERHHRLTGGPPSSLGDLSRSVCACGRPLVAWLSRDPWGRHYGYRRLGRRRWEIRSAGYDGQWHTEDDLVSIVHVPPRGWAGSAEALR